MTLVTLVIGGSSDDRERALAAAVPTGIRCAAIIEGLPGAGAALSPLAPHLEIVRIAPGCPCCNGNLTVRVTLNRLLRRAPERLYLSLSNAAHRDQVLLFLHEPQYRERLQIGPDILADPL